MGKANNHSEHLNKVSMMGMLISIGIVFGDIGTSPLYTFSAIVGKRIIDPMLVLGGLSCIFWTLTLQTTIKYVLVALSADNHGEGGIISLYARIRRDSGKWLMYPAIIGGSFLLADGIITPSISVSSAIEGLRIYEPNIPTVPIVIGILVFIFLAQQFGTQKIGRLFGPVMLVWFTFIGVMGMIALASDFSVLKAVNPLYGYRLLVEYPSGFWLLGAVFLCTTGAEALYSDMGHCGRANIRASWIYVKICLLLSYAGQTAWLLSQAETKLGTATPFYMIVPRAILPFGIVIATAAAIIASQALISGAFTLIGGAMRLNFWYRLKILYPTDFKGQLYIPQVNWFLMFGCIGVVLYFRESSNMQAAYGLAVTLTMLTTTILLSVYLRRRQVSLPLIVFVAAVFLALETSFLIANLRKFPDGGWITILIGTILVGVMWIWYHGVEYRRQFTRLEKIEPFLKTLKELSSDETIPQYATHLVYMTQSETPGEIESETVHSIMQRVPKRADIYWFTHIETVEEPFTSKYKIYELAHEKVYFIKFTLGFRIAPRINYFFKLVLEDLQKTGEININSRHRTLEKYKIPGDVRFVILRSYLSYENKLSFREHFIMQSYHFLRDWFSLGKNRTYGLDESNVVVESVPIVVEGKKLELVREKNVSRQ